MANPQNLNHSNFVPAAIAPESGREESFHASEALLKSFLDRAPVGIAILDRQLRYLQANAALAEINGRSVSDHPGRHVTEVVPDIVEQQMAVFEQVLTAGKAVLDFEVSGETPSQPGVLRSWNASYFPLYSGDRQPSGVGILVLETTAHKDAETALRQSEERYRSLVTATAQVVWNTNADGQVVTPLPSWSAYTGQTAAEIQGWGWLAAIHPDDRDRTAEAWRQATEQQQLYQVEYRLWRSDGSYRYMAVRGAPVLAEDGSIREWVGLCNDISDRQQAQVALQSRADELARTSQILAQTAALLEKRNQELDQFAYVVSHDLKAPLRAIANLSQWIEEDLEDSLTDDTRHQMNLLRGRVHRMEGLINGLLQYSRIGRVSEQIETIAIPTLLREVIDAQGIPAEFMVEIAADLPTLRTNRLLLEQVFANLIGNAVKHHDRPNGRIQITGADQGDRYEFRVTDDGPGIDLQFHSKIFGIFQTLEARDQVESTGIGLSLVKKIVESQRGTVQVESQLGQGSSFRFTWMKQS